MSELAINYTLGPLSQNDVNKKVGGLRAGKRVPYVKGLFEKLKGTQFHLLLFTNNSININLDEIVNYIQERYSKLIRVHLIKKDDYHGLAHLNFRINKEYLYLIRPDNYIAYRAIPVDMLRLQIYLQNLFCE